MDLREALWVASRRAGGGMQMSRRGPTLGDRERLGEGVFLAREDSVEVNSLPASLGPPREEAQLYTLPTTSPLSTYPHRHRYFPQGPSQAVARATHTKRE